MVEKESLVLTKNLIPHNLVIKKENDEMLIKIIDGLGSQAFVPLPSYSNFFAKRYVERRIELMDNRIFKETGNEKLIFSYIN